MFNFNKWFYPGIKIKRWIFLLVLSFIVIAVGVSGLIGDMVRNFRIEAINIDDFFRKLQRLKFIDFFLLTLGIVGISLAFRRAYFSVLTMIVPNREKEFINLAYRNAKLKRGPKVVALGGGTGMPNVLRGVKEFTSNISAVVTVADDGGSTGRLRKDYNLPAPGDIRNCIVALSDEETLLGRLFQYRFSDGGELEGHSFGNIFLTALTKVVGDFSMAIDESSKVLAIHGKVLPVSLDNLLLKAKMKDGREVAGQSSITKAEGGIEKVSIEPSDCKAYRPVIDAIKKADIIVMGPGSLYTSIIPNLLVPGVKEAILGARAVKIYVCNIMTQSNETDGFSVSDHLKAIFAHTGGKIVDLVIANNAAPAEAMLAKYGAEKAYPVRIDREEIKKLGVRLAETRLFKDGEYLRHAPDMLGKSIIKTSII